MIASRATLVGLLVVSLTTSAFAQERVCDAFTLSEYQGLMDISRNALSDGAFHSAHKAVTRVYDELRCLEVPVAPSDIATFAELSATLALMDQDEELARRWAQLRQFVSPDTQWRVQGPPAFQQYFNASQP